MSEQQGDRAVTVLVADDNAVIRLGLKALLADLENVDRVLEAVDGAQALEVARAERPHLVLLDVRMPGTDGLTVLPELVGLSTVVMLTHSDEPDVIRSTLAAGARGYLIHGRIGEKELAAAVGICLDGGVVLAQGVSEVLLSPPEETVDALPARMEVLTEREVEIMELIGSGLSNAAIGTQLFLAEKTVKNHINRIYDKLGYRTRAEAISDWLTARGAAR